MKDSTTTNPNPATAAEGEPLGEAGIKALQNEREARKQAEHALAELKEKLQAMETEFNTFKETSAKEVASLTGERDATTAKLTRMQIAHDKGLPVELIDHLNGSTAEELAASADAFARHYNPPADAPDKGESTPAVEPTPPVPGPRPDLSQGNAAKSVVEDSNPLLGAINEFLGS